jgi:hypothetical protein
MFTIWAVLPDKMAVGFTPKPPRSHWVHTLTAACWLTVPPGLTDAVGTLILALCPHPLMHRMLRSAVVAESMAMISDCAVAYCAAKGSGV